MFKKIYLILLITLIFSNTSFSNEKVFIVVNIEDQIITNQDIIKESDYLKILNPKIEKLNKQQIQEIAKNSLIKEIIKKKEIEKIFDMSEDNNIINEYIKNLYTKLNFKNEADFKNFLINSSSYTFNEIKEKIKIEIMWNELIYKKYSDQVNINKEKLIQKINKLNNQLRTEFKLSEIVFRKKKETNLTEQINIIKNSINEIGFDNTANIYNIRKFKNGGDIGWI